MIIDSHMHIGASHVTDSEYTEDQWLEIMDRLGLDAVICLPLAEAKPSPKAMHDRVHKFAQDNPGKVFGIAEVNPRWEEKEYKDEVNRCINDLGFVGLKIHPLLHGVNPAAKFSRKTFEIANDLNIPVIVHTGSGVPFALPSAIIPRAKEFPKLKIILAHSGMSFYNAEAVQVAGMFDNVYLESSWNPVHKIRGMIKAVGVDRVMMGSDHPTNIRIELEKSKDLNLEPSELERYLSGTAREVFQLNI